jgi:hypothetical protein
MLNHVKNDFYEQSAFAHCLKAGTFNVMTALLV